MLDDDDDDEDGNNDDDDDAGESGVDGVIRPSTVKLSTSSYTHPSLILARSKLLNTANAPPKLCPVMYTSHGDAAADDDVEKMVALNEGDDDEHVVLEEVKSLLLLLLSS